MFGQDSLCFPPPHKLIILAFAFAGRLKRLSVTQLFQLEMKFDEIWQNVKTCIILTPLAHRTIHPCAYDFFSPIHLSCPKFYAYHFVHRVH